MNRLQKKVNFNCKISYYSTEECDVHLKKKEDLCSIKTDTVSWRRRRRWRLRQKKIKNDEPCMEKLMEIRQCAKRNVTWTMQICVKWNVLTDRYVWCSIQWNLYWLTREAGSKATKTTNTTHTKNDKTAYSAIFMYVYNTK